MIVSLDPGMAKCGLAMVREDALLVDLAVFVSDGKATKRERLDELARDIGGYVHTASTVVIEAPAFPTSKEAAAMLWAAYALVIGMAYVGGQKRVVVYPAMTWRKALGLARELNDCPIARPPADASGVEQLAWRRAHTKARDAASKRRKSSTAELMRKRWPDAPRFLAGIAGGLHEHAYDALAIASAHLDQEKSQLRKGA